MRRCPCDRVMAGAGLPRVRTGDHMNPFCSHSSLYFTTTLMPALTRLQIQRTANRTRTFVDHYQATLGLILRQPRERLTLIPVRVSKVRRGARIMPCEGAA